MPGEVIAESSGTPEVNAMMLALEAPDEISADESGTQGGSAEGTGDVKVADVKPDEKVDDKGGDNKPDPRDEELENLRIMLRNQKKEMTSMKAVLDRHERVQKGEIGDEKAGELSEYEVLQQEIAALSERRGEQYDVLLETMELNPKYEDVRSVCSRKNFDDLIEVAAKNIAERTGKDVELVALEVEKDIWSQKNPYKYMYDNIKKYHPKYAVADGEGTEGGKSADANPKGETKPLTPAKAPGSVSALGGGDGDIKGGWTAAKIDDMDEMDLKTVPREIYDKYLQGLLP